MQMIYARVRADRGDGSEVARSYTNPTTRAARPWRGVARQTHGGGHEYQHSVRMSPCGCGANAERRRGS
jgi:hypothetical protein